MRTPRRKSISIVVREGVVSVRAAMGVPEKDLLRFVVEKSAWVSAKLAEQQLRREAIPVRSYQSGSLYPFLGKSLRLVVTSGAKSAVALVYKESLSELQVTLSSRSRLAVDEQVKRLVLGWLKSTAEALLTQKTYALAEQAGLKVNSVAVKVTRARWGQCSISGHIQYNWHIILAPEAIVDYLVAHEVSHLRHHNHSPAFWAQVAILCPNWQQHRRWLRQNGFTLVP